MAINIKNLSDTDNKQNILSNAKFEEETLILKRVIEQGEGGPLGDYVNKASEKYKKAGLSGDELYQAVAFDVTMEGAVDPVSAFPAVAKQLDEEMKNFNVDEEMEVLRTHSPALFNEFTEEQVESILKKTKQYEDVFPQKQSLLERLKEGAKNPETQKNLLKYGGTALMAASIIGTGGASIPGIVASRVAVKAAPMIGELANKLVDKGCQSLVDNGIMSQETYDSGKQKLDEMTEKATKGKIGKYAKVAGLMALGVGTAVGVSAGIESMSPGTMGNAIAGISDAVDTATNTAQEVGSEALSEASEALDSVEGVGDWVGGRVDSSFETAASVREFIASNMSDQAMAWSEGMDNPEGFVEHMRLFAAEGLFVSSDFLHTHVGGATSFVQDSIHMAIDASGNGREILEQQLAGWSEQMNPEAVAIDEPEIDLPSTGGSGTTSYGVLQSDGLNYSSEAEISNNAASASVEPAPPTDDLTSSRDATVGSSATAQEATVAVAAPEPNIYTVVENDDLSSVIYAKLASEGLVGDDILEHLYGDYNGNGSLVEQIALQNPDVFEIGPDGELTVNDIYPGEKIDLSLLDQYDPNGLNAPSVDSPVAEANATPDAHPNVEQAPGDQLSSLGSFNFEDNSFEALRGEAQISASPEAAASSDVEPPRVASVFEHMDSEGRLDIHSFLADSGVEASQLTESELASVNDNPESLMAHIAANDGQLNLSEFLTEQGHTASSIRFHGPIGESLGFDNYAASGGSGATDPAGTHIESASEATLAEGQSAPGEGGVETASPNGTAVNTGDYSGILLAQEGGSSLGAADAVTSIVEDDINREMVSGQPPSTLAASSANPELDSHTEPGVEGPDETEDEEYDKDSYSP